jgi:hypothetical protein
LRVAVEAGGGCGKGRWRGGEGAMIVLAGRRAKETEAVKPRARRAN